MILCWCVLLFTIIKERVYDYAGAFVIDNDEYDVYSVSVIIITRFIAPYLKQVLCQQLRVSLRKPLHVNFVETRQYQRTKIKNKQKLV